MKKYIYTGLFIFMILIVVIITKNNNLTGDSIKEINTQSNLETANLLIEGMTCKSCALGVEYELKQVNGVIDAKINYQDGTGKVTFNSAQVDAQTIAKASTAYKVIVQPK